MTRIDVWADVVCPFCWIGKRHLEEALRAAGLAERAEVVLHAFELDPAAGPSRPLQAYLGERFGAGAGAMTARVERMGAQSGLAFDFARAVLANTFDAHRLVLHAQAQGLGGAMMERLMRAHFAEARDLADPATLRALAGEVGLGEDDVDRLLRGPALAADVRADEAHARRIGIRGVPFFLIDGAVALSGAQPVDAFVDALTTRRA